MKFASLPLKATLEAPANPLPATVTNVPTGPLVGEKEVILGDGAAADTVKELALVKD